MIPCITPTASRLEPSAKEAGITDTDIKDDGEMEELGLPALHQSP